MNEVPEVSLGALGVLAVFFLLVACGNSTSASNGGSDSGLDNAARDAIAGDDAPSSASDAGDDHDAGAVTGDTYVPWEGGPAYWSKWKKGPPTDPNFFPIAVFWQSPSDAAAYKAIGVNTFVTFDGMSAVTALDMAGIYAWADQTQMGWQSVLGTQHLVGWNQQDEPDNAQSNGMGGYGPCVDPTVIQADYATFTANDPNRPVYLSTGQGTAWADYYGRGSACAGRVDMYAQYAKGGDLLDFDIYPVNSTDATVHGSLYYVAMGVDTLRTAGQFVKPVWAWIETTDIEGVGHLPSPSQIHTEVWMALVHEARGFGYFCHIFVPAEDDSGLLHTPSSKTGVQAIDAEVASLAPILNTQSIANWGTVVSTNANTPVDVMVKRAPGATYVFAVAMRSASTMAEFTLDRIPATASAQVIGESRTIPVIGGQFSDAFDGYAVHLYEVTY